MVRRRATGLLLFAGAAVGGAALGYLGERHAVEARGEDADPEWAALRRDPPGAARSVVAPDGTRLAVRVAGPAGAPAIVLAHSYAMSSDVWLYQVRDLADEFRVVTYDLRGHGGSGPAAAGDYSTAALGGDLIAVAEATSGGRPVLAAGHSMGGMAVMALAQVAPGRVRELLAGAALVSTASSRLVLRGLLSTGAATLGGMEQLLRGGSRRLPRASDLTHLLVRGFAVAGEASPAHVAFVEEQLTSCSTGVLSAFARTLGSLDLDAALDHLVVPTLVLAGGRDRLTPARQARGLASALPDGRLVVLPDAGHFPLLEAHAETSRLLREHARAVFGRRAVRRATGGSR